MPRVTVLMAVYNEEERWLRTSIKSILHQTFTDFEFLIINDGSTESRCQQLLEEYARQDTRISLIQNDKNIGLTASLNKGLRVARGEYIARLDSNDLAAPKRLEHQLAYLDTHPAIALVGHWVYLMNEEDEIIGKKTFCTKPQDIRKKILYYNFFTHSALFGRKDALLSVGGYTPKIEKAQDYDLLLKLGAKYPLANISEYLGFYRLSPKGISAKKYKQQERFAVLARLRAIGFYGYSWTESPKLILPILSYLFIPSSLKKQLINLLSKKA